MHRLFTDIGLVTAPHLARIASIENDSPGGGGSTSTIEDEETPEEKAAREEAEEQARLEDDEDDTRTRRSRETAAYRELQSDRDRLKTDLEKQQHETSELRERLTKIETDRTARTEVNEQTNTRLERARQRSREVMQEINKIPADDPNRGEKIYETLFTKVLEDQETTAEAISARTSRETFQREHTLEDAREQAKQETLDALEAAGLDPEDFELVEALAIHKGQRDPGWFKRVKPEEQIGALVKIIKDRFVHTKRTSKEFQEEKDRHRKPMAGVIDGGSRTPRRRETEEEDEGPGSMLADLARSKEEKRRGTKVMLRQSDFSR